MKYRHDQAPKRQWSTVKRVFWLLLVLAAVLYSFIVMSWLQEGNYNRRMQEHCEQYRVIPESQVDRVPDGCLPVYYEGK